jgi:hypothetical protein
MKAASHGIAALRSLFPDQLRRAQKTFYKQGKATRRITRARNRGDFQIVLFE